jgi:carboxymethylenebutenolidase
MMGSMGQYAEFTSQDKHRFRAYVAHPSSAPRGALVILHEMDARSSNRVRSGTSQNSLTGLSQRIRALVNEYASNGYLVIAPSLFGRGRAGHDHGYRYHLTSSGEQLQKPLQPVNSSRAMMDIQTVIDWAQGHIPQGKVGIMGYCWGGLLAWQAACTLPTIFAVTSYYGGGITNPELLSSQPLCPVLVHLPSKSHLMTQDSIDEFVKVQHGLSEAQQMAQNDQGIQMVQIHHYEAAYGFDHDGSRQHDPIASQAARLKTKLFFDKHLKL